ncbi:MAG: thiamine-phosphate kinase, partial [Candidatus Binatia bacterium]
MPRFLKARRATLAALGEFGFLDRLRRRLRGGRGVEIGPGDDCAVVRLGGVRLLLTADELVENV